MKTSHRNSILFVALILLLAALFVFSGVKILESVLPGREIVATDPQRVKTIIREGKEYFPRQDLTTIMLLGTDGTGELTASNSYNNKASADLVALMIFDESAKEFRVLNLNRDTMMDIPVLGINGKQAGTVYAQLAVSHNYGSGLGDSCENTRKAVSDFLYGLPIDYYFAMNVDGIGILNDGVGGVKVTVEEDFSQVAPELKQGQTMVLTGEQAYAFLRSRMNVGSQLNTSRMARHKQYLEAFVGAFRNALTEDASFFTTLWGELSSRAVTDCNPMVMNQLSTQYKDYTFMGCISPEGENRLGQEFYEFYPDEEALDALILELFYQEKN